MSKIKVLPCSGIGKVLGLLARESVLLVTQDKCPEETETLCLAQLVTGDDEVLKRINGETCITMDGCPKKCALKSVEAAGGNVAKSFKVADYMKAHRGEDHGTATALTADGWNYAEELADKMAEMVEQLRGEI
ncbi:putative zinc-binding protein [Eubacteriaceae bacterium ES3]|nr:putative zinc-binding protein [Eubacteriaceae bacterium ES3]